MSRLYYSALNPVRFVWENRSKAAAYNDFDFDDQFQAEQLYPFEEQVFYASKWQTTDAIRLQIIADFTNISVALVDDDGNGDAVVELNMAPKQQDLLNPGFRIYEVDISLASVTPGCYRLRMKLGAGEDADTVRSEPLDIREKHEGTVYLQYWNTKRKLNMIFEKGFRPAIRLEARFGKLKVSSNDQVYEDQPRNQTLIDSKPARIFPLYIGNEFGIPDWMLDKLNLIFGVHNVQINGKFFVKASAGQEFEERTIDGYPLRGFVFELREAINRSTLVIDTVQTSEQKLTVVTTIKPDYFGDMEGGTNQVLLLNKE